MQAEPQGGTQMCTWYPPPWAENSSLVSLDGGWEGEGRRHTVFEPLELLGRSLPRLQWWVGERFSLSCWSRLAHLPTAGPWHLAKSWAPAAGIRWLCSTQTSTAGTTGTGFHLGLQMPGCYPGCCRKTPPVLIPSHTGYSFQWSSGTLALIAYETFLKGMLLLHTQHNLPAEAFDFCSFFNPFVDAPVPCEGSQLLGFLAL